MGLLADNNQATGGGLLKRAAVPMPDAVYATSHANPAPLVANPMDERPISVGPQPPLQPVSINLPKPGFFAKNGAWRGVLADALGAFGDSLAVSNGGTATYLPNKLAAMREQREWARQDATRQQDRQWAVEDRDAKLRAPQYFMSGRDRVMYDPTSGESKTVYDGPTDFEDYANILGLEPGTAEYDDAMRDYVLRSNGPTAQQGRIALEDDRQGNRISLEGVRQRNRAALRGIPTYGQTHPRLSFGGGSGGPPRTTGSVVAPLLAKIARGEQLTPGEMGVINLYRRGGSSKAAGSSGTSTAPQTATDPKTGKKVQWNGRQWVPVN